MNKYTHEVVPPDHEQPAQVNHFRETLRDSGLLTINILGSTVALTDRDDPRSYGDIEIPCSHEIASVTASREEPEAHVFTADVTCNDLGEFVKKGIQVWQSILATLGPVRKIDYHLAEVHKASYDMTPSGLVLVQGPPQTEFVDYTASSEEIEAITKIASGVQANQTDLGEQQPGFYL